MIVFRGFRRLLISSVLRLFFKQMPSFAFLLEVCIIIVS